MTGAKKRVCRGLRNGAPCTCADLIDAHILPRAFLRRTKGDQDNVVLTQEGSKTAKAQLGLFDPGILCRVCDHELGKRYDDYAVKMLDRVPADLAIKGQIWELPNVDGDRFAKFVLSVIWRASISTLPQVTKVSLGPYEDDVRSVLFGATALSDFPAMQVVVARYSHDLDLSPEFAVAYPHASRTRVGGLRVFCFSITGFQFVTKMDARPFKLDMGNYTINSNTALRGVFKPFETSGMFELAKDAIAADRAAGLE